MSNLLQDQDAPDQDGADGAEVPDDQDVVQIDFDNNEQQQQFVDGEEGEVVDEMELQQNQQSIKRLDGQMRDKELLLQEFKKTQTELQNDLLQ